MALAVRDWTVALLLLVYVSDYVDRLLLNLFLEPIGNEFSISDLQRGMLSTAFMIFHAGGAWPIATLVERVPNRAPLLASSVLVWTIFSAATGACMNYPQLVVCRVMVGIGEAVVTPVAQSLLCDLYEPHERSTPLGYYLAGIPLGQLFGYVGGGFAAQQSSWRLAFLMVSAPGIAIAALVLHALHEPRKATFVATMPADPSVANDAQTQGGGSLRYFLTAMTVSLGYSIATCSTSSNNVRPWHCSQRARAAVLRLPLRRTFVKHACGKLWTLVSTSETQTRINN